MLQRMDLQTQLLRLTDIGTALSSERNLNRLLEMIVDYAREFTNADGGTLYMLRHEEHVLKFEILQNDTLGVRAGGTTGAEIKLPPVPLLKDGEFNRTAVSAYVANTGETVNIEDVYAAEGFDFSGTRRYDASTGYRSKSMLVVPMRDHEDEIIGVLQLLNAQEFATREAVPFRPEYVGLVTSLASQAAVAITNNRLMRDLENLFDSFIQSIAVAIEEKSRTTGGHIRRVAELTLAIAEKVNDVNWGPYGHVLFTPDELNEVRVAAWMHDVGKITTPEYVMDKSTKLETLFDRIEVVKARFEVLKREAELEARSKQLELTHSDNGDLEALRVVDEALKARLAQLDDDLAFLVTCNTGGEFMEDDKIERVKAIAGMTYEAGGERRPLLTDDEVANLSIRKGTLTAQERKIMENHALMSIKMLSQLPFPKKLRHVPEYAGGHHEHLDGSGYPLGLTADELPLPARIMAVADVFEALTAADRPYKRPMKLSQAVKILGFMVKDRHVDGDVVDLFIKTGLFKEYARREMRPEQIDDVPVGS